MVPVLVTLAVLFLVCIGCVIFVPFHLSLAGGYAGSFSGSLCISWFWGALKVERILDARKTSVYFLGMRLARVSGTGAQKEKRKRRVRPRPKRRGNMPGVLFNIPEAIRFMRKVIRSLSPKGAVRGTIGLDDPADTGILFGIASAFLALAPFPVRLFPEFRKSVVSVSGDLEIRIFIAGLLTIGIKEYLSPRGRELLRSVRGT